MDSWCEVPLGKLAEIFDGPHATPSKSDSGPVFLGISNLANGRIDQSGSEHISEENFKRWTRRVIPEPGDVVFSYETRLGEAALIPAGLRCCLGRRMGLLRARRRLVDPRFLLYAYLGPGFQETLRSRTIHGSTVDRIPLIDIAEFPIYVPTDISEQRAIAFILGTLDDKIELNRRMNETLEAMARAIFKSWFVDFDAVRAKVEGRDPGLPKHIADLFPERFEDTELGEIPVGWEVRRLGDVVSVVDYVANGSFASLKEQVSLLDSPGYALYLRTTDYNSRFSGGFRYVSKDAYEFLAKSALTGSEVIISNVGDVGTVFRPPTWLGWPMTLGSNAVALKAKGADHYLFNYFRDSVGQNAISSIVTGSAQPKFNKTNLRDLRIPLPEQPILQIFEKLASKLSDRQNTLLKESRALAAIRDTLLPKLISGELRVKDTERLLETQV